jgi:hypothetical protein
MVPVDRAGVRGEKDRVGHQVVVGHLEGTVCVPVVPGPGVVEGDGEERRVVFVRLFAGRFAGSHARMLA